MIQERLFTTPEQRFMHQVHIGTRLVVAHKDVDLSQEFYVTGMSGDSAGLTRLVLRRIPEGAKEVV